MSTFADRLRLAAAHAGYEANQSDIARAVGVTRQTVHLWYRGHKPSLNLIRQAASRLQVDQDWLESGHGNMEPVPESELTPDERELIRVHRRAVKAAVMRRT